MLLLLAACSTTHGVRPLGQGAFAPELSVGGPVTEIFGAPIPLPLSTIGASYGVTDTVDIHAAWHPTAAILTGIFGADAGVDVQLFAPHGAAPRLMADVTLVLGAGDTSERGADGGVAVFLQPSVLASWDWGKQRRQTVYTGLTGFLQPWPAHALGGLILGNRFGIGERFWITTEAKWLGPYASSEALVPTYYAPGPLGALSFQLGAGVRFGGAK